MKRYFQRTSASAARSILRGGFQASETNGWVDEKGAIIPGVWISDSPVPGAMHAGLTVTTKLHGIPKRVTLLQRVVIHLGCTTS